MEKTNKRCRNDITKPRAKASEIGNFLDELFSILAIALSHGQPNVLPPPELEVPSLRLRQFFLAQPLYWFIGAENTIPPIDS